MQQRLAALVLVGLAIAAPAAHAQKIDAATDQRIKALEARVAELERREAAHAAAPPPIVAPATPATPAAMDAPAQPIAASPAPMRAPTPPPANTAPSAAAWSGLHRGMTARQVTDLLGRPGDKRVLPLSETWYYPDTDGNTVVFDRQGRVESWSSP